MHRNRVFVDSSVMIASLLSSTGASFHIVNNFRDKVIFQINEYSLAETKKVFLKIPKKFKDDRLLAKLLLLIESSYIRILPDSDQAFIKRMEKYVPKNDAPILATTMIKSDYLITLDNDFLNEAVITLAKRQKVSILKPKDFIELFR